MLAQFAELVPSLPLTPAHRLLLAVGLAGLAWRALFQFLFVGHEYGWGEGLRAVLRIARLGQGELRAGLGSWGGAQKGASRVDVGPSATLDFPLGGGQGRVSADWRLRAAGNAAPQSEPAITLSAGF
ncbi:MAG: hypothetical protein ACK56H_08805 [Novosphingobium sp.]